MESPMSKQENAGEYFWLRYTTEFSSGGRTHTVEIAVPMRIGASEEERERLLQEADAGMNQLTRRIEQRVTQMQQLPAQVAQPPSTVSYPGTEPPPVKSKPPEPVAAPIQQIVPPPTQIRETAQESTPIVAARTIPPKEEVVVPPTRPNIGATMPSAPVKSNDVGGIMHRTDFIRYVHEHMGLDPRQAMKLLNVKSFEGLNFRDAIERLKRSLAQGQGQASQQQSSTANAPPSAQPPREARSATSQTPTLSTKPAQQTANQPAPPSAEVKQLVAEQQTAAQRPADNQEPIILEAKRPANAFEEEVEPGDEEELEELEDDFDDPALSPELSRQYRERAQDMLEKLRAMQGAAAASPTRLKALNNLVSSQISNEQLQELITGIWGAKTLNKLKLDQVDELISWAKADYFDKEVEAALELLEEEHYARGNR